MGSKAFTVTVDLYKERWSMALKREWSGMDHQPHGHFNAPGDITDKQLEELTKETKRQKIDKATGKTVGFEWYRPKGAKNELWDLLVYNSAALDMIAYDVCCVKYNEPSVLWGAFWNLCEAEALFFEVA